MYKEVRFSGMTVESRDIVVALLAEAGFDGFEEKDEALFAYVGMEKFDSDYLSSLADQYDFHFHESELPETNWNQLWESNFQPVVVDNFCAIRANFHEPIAGTAHEIIITPKMSFGTGHHATTYMMVEQMRSIDFNNKLVLDFGTGTGILAIAAEKCGAREVVAIDNDIFSIENAAENIEHNKCSNINLVQSDNADTGKKYDIILANITRNVIIDNLGHFSNSLNSPGILLLSGLLEDDEDPVRASTSMYNFKIQEVVRRDKWICMKTIR